MYTDNKFQELKEQLNNNFGNLVEGIVSKYAEEVKADTKENIKQYIWKLLPDLIAGKDLSEFGFDSEKDFYSFIDTWAVRNKIRKDFRDELMTELMGDLQRENKQHKKVIDVIVKLIKKNNDYSFIGYREAKEELEYLGIKI